MINNQLSLYLTKDNIAFLSKSVFHVILGSIFLALMAQVKIPLPFTVVPMSLQTLAVSLLAMSLGSFKAPFAVGTYLFQASLGLPVIAGGVSKSLWILSPTAGYLLACLLASYVVARVLEILKPKTFVKTYLILSLNEGIVLLFGSAWLSMFVGIDQAFTLGVAPFIPGALAKITVAATAYRPLQSFKS